MAYYPLNIAIEVRRYHSHGLQRVDLRGLPYDTALKKDAPLWNIFTPFRVDDYTVRNFCKNCLLEIRMPVNKNNVKTQVSIVPKMVMI